MSIYDLLLAFVRLGSGRKDRVKWMVACVLNPFLPISVLFVVLLMVNMFFVYLIRL